MRKFIIGLLLAGAAATPAIAGPHDSSDRQQAREDRQAAHQERQAERQEARAEVRAQSNNNRPQFGRSGGFAPQMQAPQQAFTNGGGERNFARPDRNFGGRSDGQGATTYVAPGPRMVTAPRGQFRDERIDNRNQLRDQRIQERELRQSERVQPNVVRDRHPLVVSNVPRPGTEPPLRAEGWRGGDVHWSTNWRNDRRYDWRDRRRHHRSLFHLGIFIDPFGWGYQPFEIGWRLWPAYYGNQYLIDPGLYGLPYPPPGAVWIRYWNDVILVDTYTGTVLDIIPNFFW